MSHLISDMLNIKAILFDLDNTLINFMQMKEEACKAAVKAMVTAGLRMKTKKAYSKLMETYLLLGLESDRAFTEFLKKEEQFNHKILAAAINAYLRTKTNFIKPYPNVQLTLKKLQEKGIVMMIVTDAPKTKAYQRILAMEIEQYFRFVVGFEDTNHKKQTGFPLALALEILKKEIPNISPTEILMVGDSIKRDLRPAKQLGLRTAIAKYGQIEIENEKVDYELKDINDLLKII
jgi:putative hydrolase of the HAD superfamily